jgi:hypothetical protein
MMNITHEFYSDDQHTQHEHYIDIVNTLFKFSNGDAVNAFKFSMNSNEVRSLYLHAHPAAAPCSRCVCQGIWWCWWWWWWEVSSSQHRHLSPPLSMCEAMLGEWGGVRVLVSGGDNCFLQWEAPVVTDLPLPPPLSYSPCCTPVLPPPPIAR